MTLPKIIRHDTSYGHEWRMEDGRLHNDHGPAQVHNGINEYFYFGQRVMSFEDALFHRTRIPDCLKWAMIKDKAENILCLYKPTRKMQKYALLRKPHLVRRIRNLDPSLREQFQYFETTANLPDGKTIKRWKMGHPHCFDKPAIMVFDLNGNLIREEWKINGEYHRLDGPAIIDNIRSSKHWFIMGVALSPSFELPEEWAWKLIKGDPEVAGSIHLTKEMQEYIISNRPDLIGRIYDLLPELQVKHQHELSLSGMDI